jgi:hypothetical protein
MQFRHYKGGIYEFVCAAKLESDPDTVMIVYTAADGSFWTRPEKVFFEMIEHEGKTVQRFAAIDDGQAAR